MGKIGIFVKKHESIFTNGCVQQGYFVMKALRKAGYDVTFATIDRDYDKFELLNEPIVCVLSLDQLMQYDTFVFSSLVINQLEFISYLKLLGIKVVNQMVGNYFILNAEEFVFGHHDGVIATMVNQYIDEIWLMPMYENCIEYISYITNKPVKISPYVWDDEFIQKYITMKGITPKYLPPPELVYKNKPLDIVIMEPNLSVHKNSLVPLLICNKFFTKYPDRLGQIYLVSKPSHNEKWKDSIKHLEIVKYNKITSFQRMISLEVFHSLRAKEAKFCVLSTNIRNGLNFLHLECFVLDIPIVHNCKPYSKNGLYFEDSDNLCAMDEATKHLENIFNTPYKPPNAVSAILDTYHSENKKNYIGYKQLTTAINKSNKSKIQDLIPLLSKPLNTKTTTGNGIVTFIDSNTEPSLFIKGLEYIQLNLKNKTDITVYVTSDVNMDKFEIKNKKINMLNVNIIKTSEKTNKLFYLYVLYNTPYETTTFYTTNSILAFNFIELSQKFEKTDFIVASNSELNNTDESKTYYELLKALFKLLNIEYKKENPIILDTQFLIYKSSRLRGLLEMIWTNRELFDNMFERMLMNFIILFSNCNIINLGTNIKLVGNIDKEKNVYNNSGYIHSLNGTILNIIIDENKSLEINSLVEANEIKTYINNDNKVYRSFNLQELKTLSL